MRVIYDKQNIDVRDNNPRKTGRLFLRIALVVITVVIGGSSLFFTPKGEGASVANPGGQITYPVKTFQDGEARFYQYKAGDGTTIKYFIIKSSDGVIRAAFDACDVCWPAGKGYEQKGDFMVCRNCGQRFVSIRVNEVKGRCNPSPLAREVKEGNVVLKVIDLLEGSRYFNFAKKGQI